MPYSPYLDQNISTTTKIYIFLTVHYGKSNSGRAVGPIFIFQKTIFRIAAKYFTYDAMVAKNIKLADNIMDLSM